MKKNALFVILFLFCTTLILPNANPWGHLKKIHFYHSVKNDTQVLKQLESVVFDAVKRSEQKEIAAELIRFGDDYFKNKKYIHAEAFYRKVIRLSPNYWYLYNKLEEISQANGSFMFSFGYMFTQFVMILKNFDTSFMVINHLFNLLFFSGLFVFFVFGFILLIKYFRLAGNDLIISEEGNFSIFKALIVCGAMLWPVFMFAGWMIYPFLFCGFLWFYLNDNEKKAITYMVVVVAILSSFYALNMILEDSYNAEGFNKVKKVYNGHLYSKEDYSGFDNKLKLAQALSYYENGQYDTALDILTSTAEEYKNKLKFDLMGNIYYKYGETSQSIKYFRESLKLDDKNPTALNNFALVLLKDHKPNVFVQYAKRYPEIEAYRQESLKLKEVKLPKGVLWNRLFSFSEETFSLGRFLNRLLSSFFKLPVFYFILVFLLYVNLMKKFTPDLGESTFCSKCSKIIKEASVHRSYKLCDECYQLFSIKDVIFLEAKILKEKELRKKFKKKYFIFLLFSILVPGLNFNQRENNRIFLLLSMIFYFSLGLAIFGKANFTRVFSASPLFFNLVGMLAIVVYFLVNLFSVIGDEDGI